jgi:hypothetical protein
LPLTQASSPVPLRKSSEEGTGFSGVRPTEWITSGAALSSAWVDSAACRAIPRSKLEVF